MVPSKELKGRQILHHSESPMTETQSYSQYSPLLREMILRIVAHCCFLFFC